MKFVVVLLVAIFLFSGVMAGAEEFLSSDPRLTEAMGSLKKGQDYMEKGYKEFKRRPGLAQEMFEHAEDYFIKASALYKELGVKYEIRVVNEVAKCERLNRKAHVMVGKSRKEKKKKTKGF